MPAERKSQRISILDVITSGPTVHPSCHKQPTFLFPSPFLVILFFRASLRERIIRSGQAEVSSPNGGGTGPKVQLLTLIAVVGNVITPHRAAENSLGSESLINYRIVPVS